MYKSFIAMYVKNLSLEDVKNYISLNYQDVSDEEVSIIYRYIKNRWEEIYDENPVVLEDLKKEVPPATYQKILELLEQVKKFKK